MGRGVMTAWVARFIAPDADFRGAPRLRREVRLERGHGEVRRAELTLSALGIVEAWLNGRRVSEDLLTPGWTSYEKRVRYAGYDVTDFLSDVFVLGLELGNGWYHGRLTWLGLTHVYGAELAAFAELRVLYADGHEQVVGTDTSWQAGPSATLRNDLYNGQEIDARMFDSEWSSLGYTASSWTGVHELDVDLEILEPYVAPPVRAQQEIAPAHVWTSPSGSLLVDFGQNLVGWVRTAVMGAAGHTVTLRHAEVLENEELATRPLRSAEATDRFVLSGSADVFEPRLTFHGFRYVEVDGWPGGEAALARDGGLTAVVIHSQLRRTGWFDSSHDLLNRLHENAVWGMRGNFVDVPTDCPQRDERLGWTGDLAAFAPSAVYLYDVSDLLRDWLRDLAIEQEAHHGIVPWVVPDVLKYVPKDTPFPEPETTAFWSDAAVWVPWAMWTAYGDVRVLRDQFASMTAHARRVRSLLSDTGVWDSGFQFGDWLDPDAPADDPGRAQADPGVVATLCAYRTASLVADAAAVLDDAEAVEEFRNMAERIRAGFAREYLRDGVIVSDAATVYALAVTFGILGASDRARAGRRLAELVAARGYKVSTGFAGTPFVLDALSSTGHLDAAYRMLLQTESPSWLYAATMGATTVWERWDSMLPDGSINPGEMTSFNHYAFGAVVDWLHRVVGGLSPLEPGYSRLLVAPQAGGGLTWAQARLETPHGTASVRWDLDATQLRLQITVPVAAVLRLPGRGDQDLEAGTHEISVPAPTPRHANR